MLVQFGAFSNDDTKVSGFVVPSITSIGRTDLEQVEIKENSKYPRVNTALSFVDTEAPSPYDLSPIMKKNDRLDVRGNDRLDRFDRFDVNHAMKYKTAKIGDHDLIKAALAVYGKEDSPPDGYKLDKVSHELKGFRIASYINTKKKKVIIAFRGSQNIEDLKINISFVFGNSCVYSFLENLYTGLLGKHVDSVEDFISKQRKLERRRDCETGLLSRCKIDSDKDLKKLREKIKNLEESEKQKKNLHFHPETLAEEYLEVRVNEMLDFVRRTIKAYKNRGYDIFVTGHSLGGYFAQIAAMITGLPGSSYNAPGVNELVLQCRSFAENPLVDQDTDTFVNHHIIGDVIFEFERESHFGVVKEHKIPGLNPFTAHSIGKLALKMEKEKDDNLLGIYRN